MDATYLVPLMVPFTVSFGFAIGASMFENHIKTIDKEADEKIISALILINKMIFTIGLCVMTTTTIMMVLLLLFR